MPDQTPTTPRLKIENQLTAALDGDNLANALDYISFMRARGISPENPDSNVFMYRHECVCVLVEYPVDNVPGWTIFMGDYNSALTRSDYQDFPVDASVRAFALAHLSTCGGCGCGFQPGRRISIFGEQRDNLCTSIIAIRNPDAEELELVKQLTEVWRHSITDAYESVMAEKAALKHNQWPSVRDIGAQTGRSLGKAFAESLILEFRFTPRHRCANSAISLSGGGWVPNSWQQLPLALRIGSNSRFEALKGPAESWTAIETLKYQARVTYHVEMTINVTANTYSVTVWMPDAKGVIDAPYRIAEDFPFCVDIGDPAIPPITAIDTIYLGPGLGVGDFAYIISNFCVLSGA